MLPAWYTALSKIPQPGCIYYRDNIIGPLFVLLDYYPVLMSVAIFVMSLYRTELLFRVFSMLMLLDVLINWLFREAIIRLPSRLAGCGNLYEMPSFATQHLVFVTFVLHYILLKRKKNADKRTLILLHLMTFFGTVARVYIGINTSAELYVGTAFGLVEGALVCIFFIDGLIKNPDRYVSTINFHGFPFFSVVDTILG
jgi:hypothetical protein